MFKKVKRHLKARSVSLSVDIMVLLSSPTRNERALHGVERFYNTTLLDYEARNLEGKTRTDFVNLYFETFKVLHDRVIKQHNLHLTADEETQVLGLIHYLHVEAEQFFKQDLSEDTPLKREYEITKQLTEKRKLQAQKEVGGKDSLVVKLCQLYEDSRY